MSTRARAHDLPGRGFQVAVVEDSPIQRRLLDDRLSELGFEVTAVDGGERALEVMVERRPDAVLCDVVMPGMDGFELCRAITANPQLSRIPVILLSSTDIDDSDRKLAARAGARALVSRTPGFDRIISALLATIHGGAEDAVGDAVIGDLRTRFLEEGQSEAQRLAENLGPGADLVGARRIVHRWAGRAGTLGFPRIGRSAAGVDARLREGDHAGARSAVRAVEQMFASELRLGAGPEEQIEDSRSDPGWSLPGRITAGLFGKRVALVGFTPAESERMAAALGRAKVHGVRFEWREDLPGSDALDPFDLVALSAYGQPTLLPWLEPETIPHFEQPLLLVGTVDSLMRVTPALAGQHLMLAPWDPEGLILRVYVAINLSGGAGTPSVDPETSPEIVVADDDPTITALVSTTLSNSGYVCHVAHDGGEAIELTRHLNPDALIVDINMPRRDGYEVLATMKNDRRTRTVPVVVLTARQQEVDVIRGFELGASDYVVKPFNPMELVARLRRLISEE